MPSHSKPLFGAWGTFLVLVISASFASAVMMAWTVLEFTTSYAASLAGREAWRARQPSPVFEQAQQVNAEWLVILTTLIVGWMFLVAAAAVAFVIVLSPPRLGATTTKRPMPPTLRAGNESASRSAVETLTPPFKPMFGAWGALFVLVASAVLAHAGLSAWMVLESATGSAANQNWIEAQRTEHLYWEYGEIRQVYDEWMEIMIVLIVGWLSCVTAVVVACASGLTVSALRRRRQAV